MGLQERFNADFEALRHRKRACLERLASMQRRVAELAGQVLTSNLLELLLLHEAHVLRQCKQHTVRQACSTHRLSWVHNLTLHHRIHLVSTAWSPWARSCRRQHQSLHGHARRRPRLAATWAQTASSQCQRCWRARTPPACLLCGCASLACLRIWPAVMHAPLSGCWRAHTV